MIDLDELASFEILHKPSPRGPDLAQALSLSGEYSLHPRRHGAIERYRVQASDMELLDAVSSGNVDGAFLSSDQAEDASDEERPNYARVFFMDCETSLL